MTLLAVKWFTSIAEGWAGSPGSEATRKSDGVADTDITSNER